MPLLPLATFQKGRINFSEAAAMPTEIVKTFITECSAIDIPDVLKTGRKNKDRFTIRCTIPLSS